jgi:mRNA-degrading endonuclease toxin of MazEF toxin-antitoxin module
LRPDLYRAAWVADSGNVGADEGLEHDCAIHCDGLMSLEKSRLTDYVGELSETKKGTTGQSVANRARAANDPSVK